MECFNTNDHIFLAHFMSMLFLYNSLPLKVHVSYYHILCCIKMKF